jgi:hypothetical protein
MSVNLELHSNTDKWGRNEDIEMNKTELFTTWRRLFMYFLCSEIKIQKQHRWPQLAVQNTWESEIIIRLHKSKTSKCKMKLLTYP